MISLLFILLSGLFFPGLIDKLKAWFSGRKGAPVYQPILDIIRLFRKGNVYAETSGFIFQAGIIVSTTAHLFALLLVPIAGELPLVSFPGDFILFGYLLALGRFMIILSALDIGSGFEGMGANREALYGMLAEPAFFLLVGALAAFTGTNSFVGIFNILVPGEPFNVMVSLLAASILFQILLVETSRLPVDDPRTHLELTMVHEVMVLDHSGFDLAVAQLTNALKFGIFGMIIADFFLIPAWHPLVKIGFFLGIQLVLATGIALLESFRARHKMARNPRYLLVLISFSIVLFLVVMILKNNI